jgi:hypothetical protein
MPVTIIEKPESRVYNLQQPGNENTIGCTYQVRWMPSSPTDTYPGDPTVLADANVPKPSARPPNALHSTDPWMQLAICRTVSYSPDRAAPYTWIVQANYGVVQEPYKSMGYFCRQTRNASSRTLAQYRTWAALPTNGDATWPPSSDIGGTRVDLNGQPRRREIAGQTIQLEYLWDRTTAASTTATEPPFNTFITNQGTRNSVVMFGFYPVGCLLYRGCTVTQEQETWRLIHVWTFDDIYHLEQVPVPNATGEPILLPGLTVAGQQVQQVSSVGWYQPYPTKTDHAAMLPVDIVAETALARPARL